MHFIFNYQINISISEFYCNTIPCKKWKFIQIFSELFINRLAHQPETTGHTSIDKSLHLIDFEACLAFGYDPFFIFNNGFLLLIILFFNIKMLKYLKSFELKILIYVLKAFFRAFIRCLFFLYFHFLFKFTKSLIIIRWRVWIINTPFVMDYNWFTIRR